MSLVNIFTYGTLCVSDVMYAVTGKKFKTEKAFLSYYQRCLVKNQVFPAITPSNHENIIEGVTYFDIDEESLYLIDEFESSFYDRTLVKVRNDSNRMYNAYAYVLNQSYHHVLSDKDWDETLFRELHLKNYLKRR